MSTLKADTIQSTSGGAATLTKQSAAKAWANLNGSTFGLRDSFNVASATDNGTGHHTISFSSDMSSANYSVSGGGKQTDNTSASGTDVNFASLATSSYRSITNDAGFSLADCVLNFSSVHGDLA
jgi:hypothetical protein